MLTMRRRACGSRHAYFSLVDCGLPSVSGAGPVRAGDDFQPVSVGTLPVQTATVVLVIDLARLALVRVGPPLSLLVLETAPDCVEVVLANEEGVVLRCNLAAVLDEVECGAVVELEHRERTVR